METLELIEANPLAEVQRLRMPDLARQIPGANAAVRMAEMFVLETIEDYRIAAEEVKGTKARWAAIETLRTSITGSINVGLNAVNSLFGVPQKALKLAEAIWKSKMVEFDDKQERLERQARAEAEAIAAAERKRLADEEAAIALKAADEQRMRDRAAAHAAKIAADEQERLRQVAAEAERAGNAEAKAKADAEAKVVADKAEAERIEAQRVNEVAAQEAAMQVAAVQLTAEVTTAAAVPALRPSVRGISTTKKMKAVVTDMHALVRYVAEHPQFLPLLVIDSVKMRAFTTSGMLANVPGIRLDEEKTLAARA